MLQYLITHHSSLITIHMLDATIIYNPLAGPTNLKATVEEVGRFWQRQGWRVTIQPTQRAGHAVELAQSAAAAGHRLVLASGGDGTLGEVASGLVGSETIMAPLPTGTGNSFAKELRLPRPGPLNPDGLLEASKALAAGRVQRMDVGKAETGRHWLLWASVGVDSFLVERIEPRSKFAKMLGPLGYVGEGLPSIVLFPGMWASVEVDGRLYEDDYLMVTISNCRLFAGGELMLNPQAVLDDGLFEVWFFRGRETLRIFQYLVDVALGRHLNHPEIQMVSGRQVTIHTRPPIPVHKDGDPSGKTPFSCNLLPGALRILAPNTAPAGLFSWPGEPLL
ncbi:MAG: diacylglycerol kinase family protein [Chloroflexota bacterium]